MHVGIECWQRVEDDVRSAQEMLVGVVYMCT